MQHSTDIATAAPAARRASAKLATPLGALLALALAACGALPTAQVNDPLRLDGRKVAVTFEEGAGPAALTVAAAPGYGETTFTFDDFDTDVPVTPGRLLNDISLATATLDGDTATAPETITLSDVSVRVRLWHGAGTYEAATDRVQGSVSNATLTLARVSCAATCAYAFTGDGLALGQLQLTGSAVAAALRIGSELPEPNHGHVVIEVQGEPEAALRGRTLTLELEASQGSVGF